MFDLSKVSQKILAQFGLTVTLIVFLAACSHKPVQLDVVSATPGPTPDIVAAEDAAPVKSVWPDAKRATHKHPGRNKSRKTARVAFKPKGNHGAAFARVEKEIAMPPKSDLNGMIQGTQMTIQAPPAQAALGGLSDGSTQAETPSFLARAEGAWKLLVLGLFVGALLFVGARATRGNGKFGRRRRKLIFNA